MKKRILWGIALTGILALAIGTLSFFISDYDQVAAEIDRFYQEEIVDHRQTIYDEDLADGVKSLEVKDSTDARIHVQEAADYRVQVKDLPEAGSDVVQYEDGKLTIQAHPEERSYPLEVTLYGPNFSETTVKLHAPYLALDSQVSLANLALEADEAELDLRGEHSYPMQIKAGYVHGDMDFDQNDLAFAVLEGQLGFSLNGGTMNFLPAGDQGQISYKLGKGDQDVQLRVNYSAIDVTTTN
ncbi:hypothetical protein ACWOE5_05530 [Aerococcus sanguinicola]|uniref:Adhesin domain-containing protein n=1 Tax=Aerococcus sanguinicola TaxID=119206 RepID=A0A0X8FB40_9LACT|nr:MULTISPECIES: hypothetical protein [Aerococcus]AMB94111.1 hypothetical protein AWM72_04730 [Aerococcus sanguinicola]MDK7050195.1 hypothetical protein [Aerococcus sanguinicola]OFT92996.1 hypothetical protein HMPREF3090_07705 [Aerococcus sp. HMSC23C02]PKZ22201.1 hypothetical protein CYJ28_03545 [Aerococcus sanguinicola]